MSYRMTQRAAIAGLTGAITVTILLVAGLGLLVVFALVTTFVLAIAVAYEEPNSDV